MKKLLITAALSALILSGCGNSTNSDIEALKKENAELKSKLEQVESTTVDTSEVDVISTNSNNSNDSTENDSTGLDVNKYMYETTGYKYAILQIKNTTNDTLDISANILLKDDSGNIVGVKNPDECAVAPQQEILLRTLEDTDFTDFDYQLSTKKSIFNSAYNDAEITSNQSEDKVIVTATNKGNKDLNFLKATVIFFQNNQPVYSDETYLTGSGTSLAPGATEYNELKSYAKFDSYKIFITGRCD